MYFILHMLYKKSAALPSLSFVPQDTFGQEMYALITWLFDTANLLTPVFHVATFHFVL